MFVTNHALAGASIGALARHPLTAFAAGVASHLVMDMTLHYGDQHGWDHFLKLARIDGTIGLAVTATVAGTAPRAVRVGALAGLAGACIIDMDKPGRHFFGRSPFPEAVDRFHARIQNEVPWGGWIEAAAAALLTVGVATVFRSRRPTATAGG